MSLSSILGVAKPIIQAPMAGVQNWELAVAVSEAGGLGSIPCGMLAKEQILSEVEQFKLHSDKPYNLNFFCHEMPELDEKALKAWENCLGEYYTSLDVQPPKEVTGLRYPFDEEIADLLEVHKPPVMSFHFGLPSAELVKRIKSWGSIILSSATTEAEGVWLQENGADIVIAQGNEAGGHRGMFLTADLSTQVSTKALVENLSRVLSIPVIAAGGIASNRDVQEMTDLGAVGVQVGTSFLLCDEAKTSKVHRAAVKSEDHETALTNIFSGRPARGISNKIMRELNFMSDAAPKYPYASIALSTLKAKAESQNKGDFSSLWAGTNTSACKEVPAKQIVLELCRSSS